MQLWRKFETLRVHTHGVGGLWAFKGQEGIVDELEVRVDLHRQFVTMAAVAEPGLRMTYTPDRVSVETGSGEPFWFAEPGFETSELEPWDENGETWRRLRVRFPEGIATHNRENVYYVDDQGLIRRHDYASEVLGAELPAAHYVSDYEQAGGLLVPTRRRVYLTDEEGRPMADHLMVSIDLSDWRFA